MKKITLLFIFVSFSCFSQSYIEGFIIDKTTNESLPFATIKLISSSDSYTITNEDGKFEIKSKLPTDSLEVRFLGYQTKKVPITFFKKNVKLFISPNPFALNEVVVVSDKNYVYNLLYRLIKKYRKQQTITESKTFLTLSSSSKGIPIEHIEGFYNSKQSLLDGILDLKIKSGRFGQNKSFNFYSLNNTDILTDFQFFKNSNQILPLYPGNMTLRSIKGKYVVKMEQCDNCKGDDVSISFSPKEIDGNLFHGNILFDSEKLVIKKIELKSNNPITKGLEALLKNDVMTPKEIKLNIAFNTLDFNKIQYLNFTFSLYYKSDNSYNIITSQSFLYFYDYAKPFIEPYFNNRIHFNNDYDKIIALQANDDFWNLNYQFPKSFTEKRSINFLKNEGYLINFETSIPSNYVEHLNPSVISWEKNKRLSWSNIKETISKDKKQIDRDLNNQGIEITVDKEAHSISEFKSKKNNSEIEEEYNFSYMLDMYLNEDGERQYVTRTLFNRNSSFCKYDRLDNKLIYVGLIFDVYEIYNQQLKNEISNEMTFEEAKILSSKIFNEASKTVEKMKNETNAGLNYQILKRWETTIKQKLYSEI
ncbi:MAG: hypothetical protein CVU01_00165 [Bacteroidetes bacterium HGW-Bacteroidetes-18]|nr:MAG: hypothetical protein CVU01_00165 [Bacteroidetes bacterium HGW-Bacteroidetes-18]